jgi:purine-cytosine permease-like protein
VVVGVVAARRNEVVVAEVVTIIVVDIMVEAVGIAVASMVGNPTDSSLVGVGSEVVARPVVVVVVVSR